MAKKADPGSGDPRERRDIVSGEVRPEGALIRFVAGPDQVVTPDLGRRLPGRGLWVAANRSAVETAANKGLFARAAKAPLTAPAGLADQVEALLVKRLLDGLGLARKAGDLTFGFAKVAEVLKAGRAALLIEAIGGAPDGRRKLLAAARGAARQPRLIGLFSATELSLALGAENVIHLAFLAGRGADRWTSDVERLSGFRPSLPAGWCEDS